MRSRAHILTHEVLNLDDLDDFDQLFADLLDDLVIAEDHNGHPAEGGVVGTAHGQRIDIKRPRRKHPGHMGQNTGPIQD
jgi:hypothetical protein